MTLRIKIQISREGQPDDRGYQRWDDLASFQADEIDDAVWEVYRQSVAALTPEAEANHWPVQS